MLHRSFYIQGNSATIRFPILPHFVSENPLHFVFRIIREGAFFFTRRTLFPPLDKRNTRDKAKGLHITSEGHIEELGVRYLSRINSG